MIKAICLAVLLVLIILVCSCNVTNQYYDSIYKSKIINIEEYEIEQGQKVYPVQDVEVLVLEGEYEGEVFKTQLFVDVSNYKNFMMYKVNDRVNVEITKNEESGELFVSIYSLVRVGYIALLAVLFLAAIVLIAGINGVKTIIALIVTVGCVIFIIVPLVSKGYSPIITSLITGVGITIFTLVLVGGVNKKTLSAVVGTLCGLVCATIFTIIASSLMRVTGVSTEAVGMIMISEIGYDLDIRGIFTSGIIIGCLGAVMDVGMSISSSIYEMNIIGKSVDKNSLFKSGMSVGRDIMGTMTNTLILAYTGGTIMQMVVWNLYGISFLEMLNREYIAAEVVKALCGSLGMVLTIPITCFVASRLIGKKMVEV